VLGSLSVELRIARALPPGRRTTYSCAKRYTPLVGASRERVLRSLGPPDRTARTAAGPTSSQPPRRAPAGTPELVFRFDGAGVVAGRLPRTRLNARAARPGRSGGRV
jgi:hypothetical protein